MTRQALCIALSEAARNHAKSGLDITRWNIFLKDHVEYTKHDHSKAEVARNSKETKRIQGVIKELNDEATINARALNLAIDNCKGVISPDDVRFIIHNTYDEVEKKGDYAVYLKKAGGYRG